MLLASKLHYMIVAITRLEQWNLPTRTLMGRVGIHLRGFPCASHGFGACEAMFVLGKDVAPAAECVCTKANISAHIASV